VVMLQVEVTPLSVMVGYRRFGSPCCLNLQDVVVSGIHDGDVSGRGLLGCDAM
jgi:hypothetical protein